MVGRAYLGNVLRERGILHDLELYRKFPSLMENSQASTVDGLGVGLTTLRGAIVRPAWSWLRGDVNEAIRVAIEKQEPFMAARLGRGELRFLSKVMLRRECGWFQKAVHRWIEGTDLLWSGKDGWFKEQLNGSVSRADKFYDAYIEAMQQVDFLGSWSPGESLFSEHLEGCKIDTLRALEPFRHSNPWSSALEGKSVLVVHPFAKSLTSQYSENRTRLFQNPAVLPSFQLKTLIPFMEGIRNPDQGVDLIAQLRILVSEISQFDADVIIIGAGPLGFPLAAEAKRLGKVSIHLGGATQTMFGVRGKRWDELEGFDYPNQYWVRPRADERPVAPVARYDQGAYW